MDQKETGILQERRKCLLPALSCFSTLFSKDIFLIIVKTQDYLVKFEIAWLYGLFVLYVKIKV